MMNRRLFLGQASAFATLALPLTAALPAAAKTASSGETRKLILSYKKIGASPLESGYTDFGWTDMNRYHEIEQSFLNDGSLKSVSREHVAGQTEIHFVFKNDEALSRYLAVLANVASPKERAAAGFELDIRIG